MTSFISNIESTSNGKKESIYWTYHNGSSATKSGPAEDAEAQVEPLDFLRCFDLVVNLFSVTLLFECQPPENARKPLKIGNVT